MMDVIFASKSKRVDKLERFVLVKEPRNVKRKL